MPCVKRNLQAVGLEPTNPKDCNAQSYNYDKRMILLSAARLTTSLRLLKGTPLGGLEPPTFRLTAERSSQLSHKGEEGSTGDRTRDLLLTRQALCH